MAYQYSLEDMDEVDKKKGGYQWTAEDMDEVEKNPSLAAQYMQQLQNPHNNPGRAMLAGILSDLGGVNAYKNKIRGMMGRSDNSEQESKNYQDLINKILPSKMAQQPESQRAMTAGKLGPLLAIPGGPELEAGEGALAFLPKIPSLLKSLGYNFGVGEAVSPVFNPKESLSDAYKEALLPSAAGALAGPAYAMGKNALGGLLRQGGTASAEEFERNVKAAKELGIKLPIGQAAESPNVKGFQSATLANVPFSGMAQHFTNVGKNLKEGSNEVVDSLKTLPEKDEESRNPLKQIMGAAKKKYEDVRKESFNNYKSRNDYADSIEEKISDRSEIKNTADDILAGIQRRKEENPNTPIDSQALKDLEDASAANPMSFEGINPLRDRYRQTAKNSRKNGDNYTASIYERLLGAHNSDIEKNLQRINDPKLTELNNKANQHYSEWIAPTKENKTLNKYLSGRGNADLLVEAFSRKGWDQPETQAQIMKYLSPKEQRQYAGEYLSKFEHQGYDKAKDLNEDRMLTNYQNLGDQTKEILFRHAPEEKQKLDAMTHVRKMYDSDIKQLLNPKSGEKAAKQWLYTLGLLSNIPTVGGVGAGSHLATHYLASPVSKSFYRQGLKLKDESTKPKVSASVILNGILNGEDTQ
jgi:hypothetical protein